MILLPLLQRSLRHRPEIARDVLGRVLFIYRAEERLERGHLCSAASHLERLSERDALLCEGERREEEEHCYSCGRTTQHTQSIRPPFYSRPVMHRKGGRSRL